MSDLIHCGDNVPTSSGEPQVRNLTYLDSPETTVNCGEEFPLENPPALGMESDYRKMKREKCGDEWLRGRNLYFLSTGRESSKHVRHYDDCCTGAAMYHNSTTGELKVISGACNLRWCPICAKAKAAHVTDDVIKWLEGRENPRFITLTLKHDKKTLGEKIDELQTAWRAMQKRERFREYCKVGIWFLQITFNKKKGEWHPHMHMCVCGSYYPLEELRQDWRIASKGSYIVDIQGIGQAKEAASYVGRYVGRPCSLSDIPESKYAELYYGTIGRRLYGQFGDRSQKILTPKPKLDTAAWRKICSLKQLIEQSLWDWDSWRIIKAWQTKTPILDPIPVIPQRLVDYNLAGNLIMWEFHDDGFECYQLDNPE